MSRPRVPASQPARAARKLLLILSISLVITALVTLVTNAGLDILSAVRAYVGGEGLWSKAQKDAVNHLRRYSESRDERDFAAYRAAVAVPLGDRKAR